MRNDIKHSANNKNDNSSIENDQKLREMEKSVKRLKRFGRIKLLISLFIVIGLIVYLIAVYMVASSLTIEDKTIK